MTMCIKDACQETRARLLEARDEIDALAARCAELEAALAFYADIKNHHGDRATGHVPIVDDDNLGDKARAALGVTDSASALHSTE